jgi:hypothetical protein
MGKKKSKAARKSAKAKPKKKASPIRAKKKRPAPSVPAADQDTVAAPQTEPIDVAR